jgi:site-specific DNA recombinase
MTQPSRCAAIYARVSTDKQSQLSTSDQVRKCCEYASPRGLMTRDEHIYVDEAMSGVGSDRPAFQRMMSAAVSSERPFAVILVDDTSRLSRNTEEALGIFRRLSFAGVQLIAVSQGIDSNDDQADVLVTVHGMVDSLYVKELAQKIHRGLEGLALRGLHTGGRCYGYDAVSIGEGSSKRLIVNEAEAAVVRRIFEMSAKGVALKKIAATLNAEKLSPPRPRRGRRASWCPTAIREMLRRELYVGRVIWNRSKFVKAPGTNR